jgi:hypothetical protein
MPVQSPRKGDAVLVMLFDADFRHLAGVASEVLTGGGKDCCRPREDRLHPTGGAAR